MNRTNSILLGGIVLLAAVYFLALKDAADAPAGPAPRLFPEFNKEAADRIEISEGWIKNAYDVRRVGSKWLLASAGDYPIKAETATKLIDAVAALRAENEVTSDPSFRKTMLVDEQGRRVRVFRGDTVMADFRVGGNPKGAWKEFFIRKEDASTIYRTSTVLNPAKKSTGPGNPWDTGNAPFSWDTYVQKLGVEWLETEIFSMGDGEVQEVALDRPEGKIRIVREGQDQWKIVEPEEAPADTDAVVSLTGGLRYFSMADVLGKSADVGAQHGLDAPQGTIIFTVKKKLPKKEPAGGEKKEGEAPEGEKQDEGAKEPDGTKEPEGGEKKDEAEKKEEPKDEFLTIRYTVKVGKEFKRAERREDDGKIVEGDYYPLTIAADPADEKLGTKSEYVFAVSGYSVGFLKKKLDELKQKPKEEKKEEGAGGEGAKEHADEQAHDGEAAPHDAKKDEPPPEPPKEPETPKEPEKAEEGDPKPPEPPDGPSDPKEPSGNGGD